jgi:hypothetical protein
MSLVVDVFVVDGDGELCVQDVPAGCSDLAGPESWRTAVWGSDVIRSLGAVFFPMLASGDLTVAPDHVAEFIRECALIRGHLEAVASRRDPAVVDDGYVRQVSDRLASVENAAERALRTGAGVIIW